MTMHATKKIEDFLDWKNVTEHSEKYHLIKVLREVLGNRDVLFHTFTEEIKVTEQFRTDLASSLSIDKLARQKIAERWMIFLKPRINVLELWSSMLSAFAAIFGLASTLFTLVSVASNQTPPTLILTILVLIVVGFLVAKFHIDKRAFWYKFVVTHLEAIAHGL